MANQISKLCLIAIKLCQNPVFQEYVIYIKGEPSEVMSREEWAKRYLCEYCGVTSRKDIHGNIDAMRKLAELRTKVAEYSKTINNNVRQAMYYQ